MLSNGNTNDESSSHQVELLSGPPTPSSSQSLPLLDALISPPVPSPAETPSVLPSDLSQSTQFIEPTTTLPILGSTKPPPPLPPPLYPGPAIPPIHLPQEPTTLTPFILPTHLSSLYNVSSPPTDSPHNTSPPRRDARPSDLLDIIYRRASSASSRRPASIDTHPASEHPSLPQPLAWHPNIQFPPSSSQSAVRSTGLLPRESSSSLDRVIPDRPKKSVWNRPRLPVPGCAYRSFGKASQRYPSRQLQQPESPRGPTIPSIPSLSVSSRPQTMHASSRPRPAVTTKRSPPRQHPSPPQPSRSPPRLDPGALLGFPGGHPTHPAQPITLSAQAGTNASNPLLLDDDDDEPLRKVTAEKPPVPLFRRAMAGTRPLAPPSPGEGVRFTAPLIRRPRPSRHGSPLHPDLHLADDGGRVLPLPPADNSSYGDEKNEENYADDSTGESRDKGHDEAKATTDTSTTIIAPPITTANDAPTAAAATTASPPTSAIANTATAGTVVSTSPAIPTVAAVSITTTAAAIATTAFTTANTITTPPISSPAPTTTITTAFSAASTDVATTPHVDRGNSDGDSDEGISTTSSSISTTSPSSSSLGESSGDVAGGGPADIDGTCGSTSTVEPQKRLRHTSEEPRDEVPGPPTAPTPNPEPRPGPPKVEMNVVRLLCLFTNLDLPVLPNKTRTHSELL